ncbi:hypothetical protein KRR40_08865 [Niabella defluvii]|nr:hypothetical protein KRR40_08865 [Niabella sp. I65]
MVRYGKTTRRKNITTSWFGGLDIGFSNFTDNTNYTSGAPRLLPLAQMLPGST